MRTKRFAALLLALALLLGLARASGRAARGETDGIAADSAAGALCVELAIESYPANGTYYVPGETLALRVTVRNDTDETLRDIAVADPLWSGADGHVLMRLVSLNAGKAFSMRYARAVTALDAARGCARGCAAARAVGSSGERFAASGTVSAPVGKPAASLRLARRVLGRPANCVRYAEGETVRYAVVALNAGSGALEDVVVRDALSEADARVGTLAPGKAWVGVFSHVVTPREAEAGCAVGELRATGWTEDGAQIAAAAPRLSLSGFETDAGIAEAKPLTGAEGCALRLTGRGTGAAGWSLRLCPVHAALFASAGAPDTPNDAGDETASPKNAATLSEDLLAEANGTARGDAQSESSESDAGSIENEADQDDPAPTHTDAGETDDGVSPESGDSDAGSAADEAARDPSATRTDAGAASGEESPVTCDSDAGSADDEASQDDASQRQTDTGAIDGGASPETGEGEAEARERAQSDSQSAHEEASDGSDAHDASEEWRGTAWALALWAQYDALLSDAMNASNGSENGDRAEIEAVDDAVDDANDPANASMLSDGKDDDANDPANEASLSDSDDDNAHDAAHGPGFSDSTDDEASGIALSEAAAAIIADRSALEALLSWDLFSDAADGAWTREEMLMGRCLELCRLRRAISGEAEDDAEKPLKMTLDAGEICARSVTADGDSLRVVESLCANHRLADGLTLRAQETRDADAIDAAVRLWRAELDGLIHALWLRSDAAGRDAIAQWDAGLSLWLEARGRLLTALWPDDPAEASLRMIRTLRDIVIGLCPAVPGA